MAVDGRGRDAAKSLGCHPLKVFEPLRLREEIARPISRKFSIRELVLPFNVESPPPEGVLPGDLHYDLPPGSHSLPPFDVSA